MGKAVLAAAVAAMALVGSAHAAERSEMMQGDHNGAREIASGDYARAERVLSEARRIAPHDPDLMLNLAQVYARSDRADAARVLYRQVLAQPDETMLLSGDRQVRSHALARQGLQAIAGTTLVLR